MKKLMTMLLAVIPFTMFAQDSQEVYAVNHDIFNMSYADVGSAFTDGVIESKNAPVLDASAVIVSENDLLKVNDMLFADPNFDIQENMISYTKDQKTVFFSANKKIKEKTDNQKDDKIKNSVQLQLFKASVSENGEWTNLEMLPFNGKRHSTGHPALNKDDTQLYFVSDGPESTGKTDIFVVDLFEDGTYGQPANLGSKINTEEREVFPFVDDSSVLYFESDIKTDGSELNVFASKLIDNELTTPIILDVEANGSKEEYISAFKAVDDDAMRLVEQEENLRDIEILMEAEGQSEIIQIEEDLVKVINESAYDFTSNYVVYTVQIGAYIGKVKPNTPEDSSGLFNHLYDDGYNRYYSGVFKTNKEALVHLEQMIKDGHKDAFVIGLDGKKRFLPE